MPFPVLIRKDLSLKQLRDLHNNGCSVMKTPHIGNIYPNNLGVAQIGIPMVFYDRTFGHKDRNFHPHGVIRSRRFECLSAVNVMTTHTKVERHSKLAPEWFVVGESMAKTHMRATKAAVPNMMGSVYTDFLRAHREDAERILQIVTQRLPQLWERAIDTQGYDKSFRASDWVSVMDAGIFGLTHDDQGALIPNVVNILLLSLLDAKEKGVEEAYHLSGPDMVVYIGDLQSAFHTLYDAVRGQIPDWNLPEMFPLHLVPVADMRFVVLPQRQAVLDELVESHLSLERNNKEYGQRLARATPENRRHLIAEVDQFRGRDKQRLINAASACQDVFYRIAEANTVSQYDVFDAGGIYVHPWAFTAPMKEISCAMQNIERYAKSTR